MRFLEKEVKMKNTNLTVEVKEDALLISIGTETLCHSCEVGRRYGLSDIKITDKKQFLASLTRQLEFQDEDGSTLMHEMFDSAVTAMLENGELGVDELEDV